MRKLLLGAIVASTTLAFATPAFAQESTFKASVSPKKAGTKNKPKNTKLGFKVTLDYPATTVEFIDLGLPKGLKLSGKGFKKCSVDTIGRNPADCPAGSKAGPEGTATALLGANNTPLRFSVQGYVVNSTSLAFYVAETTGLQVQSPLLGKITENGRHLRIQIPFELRQPVQGVDASLTSLDQKFSAKAGKKYLVSSTGCKKKKHKFTGKLTFSSRADGAKVPSAIPLKTSTSCKK